MKKTRIYDGRLLAVPASLLALSMGCATPVEPTEEPALDDTDIEMAEDVDESSDALAPWDNAAQDDNWSEDWDQVQGIEAYSPPSVAVVGETPHMAYVGPNNQCFLSSYGGGGWASPAVIPGCVGPYSPNLAVVNNSLYAGYLGTGGGCYLNNLAGWGWGNPLTLSGCGGAFAPVVAPFGGALNVVYGGLGGGIYHSSCGIGFGGLGGCGAGAVIPGVATPYAPALGVYGNTLGLAYTGLGGRVFYTSLGGGWGGGWANPFAIRGAYANWGPTLGWGGPGYFLGVPGFRGGLGWGGWGGAGWGRFGHVGAPWRGARFGAGWFGPRFGYGALAAHGGRLWARRWGGWRW